MIVDSSALLAILLSEPGHLRLVEKIRDARVTFVGAPTVSEAAIVLMHRSGDGAALLLEKMLRGFGIEIVAFGPEHCFAAAAAFLRYGKGRHPAALNYGDCMAYAVASVSGLPLLYVGRDFSKTDILSA